MSGQGDLGLEQWSPRGTAKLDQLRRMAELPFAAKLEWLEEMHRVVRELQRQSAARKEVSDAANSVAASQPDVGCAETSRSPAQRPARTR